MLANSPNQSTRNFFIGISIFTGVALLAAAMFVMPPAAAAAHYAGNNIATNLNNGPCVLPATVTTAAELADCITEANNNGAGMDTITLGANVMLTGTLLAIDTAITLDGSGFFVDGANSYRVFEVTATGAFTASNVTIQNGSSASGGAGILNNGILTVSSSTFADNATTATGAGGGIENSGLLTVTDSIFSGNSATGGGGGILNRSTGTLLVSSSTFASNTSLAAFGAGGAIYNLFGAATVTDSTLSDNSAFGGGGIFNEGTLAVMSSTFSGNSATGSFDGGGIVSSGMLTVTSSTFFDNSTVGSGGALHNIGTVYLAGSIFDAGPSGDPQCGGTLTDNGYNLSSDDSCDFDESSAAGSADLTVLNLGPLSGSDPGEQVHTPLAPSAAIGVIPNGTSVNNNGVTLACNQTTTDQLGANRPIVGGQVCTSGAVEVTPPISITIVKEAAPADGTDFPFTTNAMTSGDFLLKWGSSGNGNGQFNRPNGVAVSAAGDVYVVDSVNHRIQKFDSSGTYLDQWGGFGFGSGQFNGPIGIAVAADGNVYVTDADNGRIQKFDGDGTYLTEWGTSGNGNGQFNIPNGVAVAADGTVYVADTANHRIQMFDANGIYLDQWGSFGSGSGQFNGPNDIAVAADGNVYVVDTFNDRIQMFDSNGTYLDQWGSSGSGNGQFDAPNGVAIDAIGQFFVADSGNHRIQKFDSSGSYLTKWGSNGSDEGQFSSPSRIGVDATGKLYVSDNNNHRIQKFGNNLFQLDVATPDDGDTFTQTLMLTDLAYRYYSFYETVPNGWELGDVSCDGGSWFVNLNSARVTVRPVPGGHVTCTYTNVKRGSLTVVKDAIPADGTDFAFTTDALRTDNFLLEWGSFGTTDGLLHSPQGVAVAADGSVYVADSRNHRIQKFDGEGTYLTQWGSFGSGDGQFDTPRGVAVAADGTVYVVDTDNNRIQKFDGNGTYLAQWGINGSGQGEFDTPVRAAVAPDGSVYVTDLGNDRIQKFDSSGTFLLEWGTFGTGNGQFRSARGVAVAPDGTVYVSDSTNDNIQKFDSSGNFLTKWGSSGSGDGQFSLLLDIAVDRAGNVYAVDNIYQLALNRMQKFDSNGTFLAKWGSYGEGPGQFIYPYGVAVDVTGEIYVTDFLDSQVLKFGSNLFSLDDALPDDGDRITSTKVITGLMPGSYEVTESLPHGGMWDLTDIVCTGGSAVSDLPGGTVIVEIPSDIDVVCQFSNTKRSSITIVKDASPQDGTDFTFTTDALPIDNFLLEWGSNGSGNGEFNTPRGMAVDGDGNVYVADYLNHRIQKFDPFGNYISQWGSSGTADGQFRQPSDIAVAADGSIYVADWSNRRIQKFDALGNHLLTWGSSGSADGQFNNPYSVAVDSIGNVYVADAGNDRIQKFDSGGNHLLSWGSNGNGDGEFDNPFGVAVAADGSVYVADRSNYRIQKFDSNGNFLLKWGNQGGGEGQFDYPFLMAVDEEGTLYVTDVFNDRIQAFDDNGTFLFEIGSSGSGAGQFDQTRGVAVDAIGDIYVTDTENHRIQKFGRSFRLDVAMPDDGDDFMDTKVIAGLVSGSYTFTETVPVGWSLTALACDTGVWNADLDNANLTVSPLPGEDITCTFTNTETSTLDLGIAITNNSTATLSWILSPMEDCNYDIYSSTLAFSGYSPLVSDWDASPYQHANAIGNTAVNHYYYVEAVGCPVVGLRTGYVGEFDFAIVPGN